MIFAEKHILTWQKLEEACEMQFLRKLEVFCRDLGKTRVQVALVEMSETVEHTAVTWGERGSPYKVNGVLMVYSWENLQVIDKQERFLTKMSKAWPGSS